MSARAGSSVALALCSLAVIAAATSPGAGQDAPLHPARSPSARDRAQATPRGAAAGPALSARALEHAEPTPRGAAQGAAVGPAWSALEHAGPTPRATGQGAAAGPASSARELVEPFSTRHGGPRLEVVARVRTGVLPKSVSVSPDGTRLAVCNFGRLDAESVHLFDAATLERLAVIEFAGNAVESVWSSDGATLYVSNFRRGVVEVIDVATATVRTEIATGVHPKFMVLSRDDATLYVANYGDRSVSVIDVAQAREVRRLATERQPRGLALRDDGTLFAAAFRGGVVHTFGDGASAETMRWEACEMPRHLLLSRDGATMFVTCSLGTVGFYDPRTGRRFGTALTGRNPRTIAMNADGRWIGVANFSSSDVTLIDTVGRRHRNYDVPRARGIVGLAMDPGPAPRLYVTSWETGELIVLARRVPVGSRARAAREPSAP